VEGAIWTERVSTPEILEFMISPRINALAESSWTIERNYEEFLKRLKVYMEDLKLMGLNGASFEAATISGEAAQAEAKQFIMMLFQFLQNSDDDMGLNENEKQVMLSKFLNNIFDEKTAQEFLQQIL
jgi:hexosaminidase